MTDNIDLDDMADDVLETLHNTLESTKLDSNRVFERLQQDGIEGVKELVDTNRPEFHFTEQVYAEVQRELGFTQADRAMMVLKEIRKYIMGGIEMRYEGHTSELARIQRDDEAIEYLLNDIDEHLRRLQLAPTRTRHAVRLILALGDVGASGEENPDTSIDPHPGHHQYADDVLDEDVSDQWLNRLARRTANAVQKLTEILRQTYDIEGYLHDHDRRGDIGPGEGDPSRSIDGLLWLDHIGLEWMDEVSNGAIWGDLLETERSDLEQARRDCLVRYKDKNEEVFGEDLLVFWFNEDETVPNQLRPVNKVAEWIWQEEIRSEWEREQGAEQYNVPAVPNGGDDYTKVPKVGSAIDWTFDGPGDVGGTVEVNNNRYADAPDVIPYLPRAKGVMPENERPSQQTFGAGFQDELPFAVRAVNDTQAVLGATEAKLTLFLLVTANQGRYVVGEFGDLIDEVHKGVSRVKPRHREKTAKALRHLRSLVIILSDDTDIPIFSIRAPIHPGDTDPTQTIKWSYSPNLLDELREGGELSQFRGGFLINFDAVMRFNGNQTHELRHYVAACSMWNDASPPGQDGFSRDYLISWDRETWGARANVLSKSTIDYLLENQSDRLPSWAEDT